MKITPTKYANSLLEALEGAPKKMMDIYLDNFLKIIKNNDDEKKILDIFKEIKKIEREKSGIKNITITTATTLSTESLSEILKKLEKIFSSKIELHCEINPTILGGIVIESDEEFLDKSLRNYINKFKHSLAK